MHIQFVARHASTALALLACLAASPVLEKRSAPRVAKQLMAGDIRFQTVHDRYTANQRPAGIRAYVEAWDVKADKSLWKVKVYEIVYDQHLETDVQDVYIESLALDGKWLVATTERRRVYRIDVERHEVEEAK